MQRVAILGLLMHGLYVMFPACTMKSEHEPAEASMRGRSIHQQLITQLVLA